MGTCVRIASEGRPYQRFKRALATGNLTLIRSSAAELPPLQLADAAAVLLVTAQAEPQTYERAALRWLERLCSEARDADLSTISEVAAALRALPNEPGARRVLADACRDAGELEAARVFAG